MRFSAQLFKDGVAVPHQSPLAIPVADLGGGMSLFEVVGGPGRDTVDYVQVSHVLVSLVAGPHDAPFSRMLPVTAENGVVAIRRGSTAVVVWRGLDEPVYLAQRLEGMAQKVRAAIDAASASSE